MLFCGALQPHKENTDSFLNPASETLPSSNHQRANPPFPGKKKRRAVQRGWDGGTLAGPHAGHGQSLPSSRERPSWGAQLRADGYYRSDFWQTYALYQLSIRSFGKDMKDITVTVTGCSGVWRALGDTACAHCFGADSSPLCSFNSCHEARFCRLL